MRGIKTTKSRLRKIIFTEVAKMAFEGWDEKKFENLPYKIIQGDVAQYRDSVFVEREVVAERLRAAMGVSLRDFNDFASICEGVDESLVDEKYYEPPLIDIIKFACNRCPENRIFVTNACQNCLEHPCVEVCPKKAVSIKNGRSFIDEEKCVKCGMCMNACSYHAIVRQERPCAKVCGMNAIKSDALGRAEIDPDKCVSCGMCLVNCPFGAIIDKSQIYQTITALKSKTPVYAAIAPAFAGQFGNVSTGKIRTAFKELGFEDVVEVAVGADLCTIEEAQDFMKEVPEKQPFMATSCCPAWSVMAKKLFPEFASYISMALTPMVLTARLIKEKHPECKVVFVGPCAAKKLEASHALQKIAVIFARFCKLQHLAAFRQTFYYHFADIQALINWGVQQYTHGCVETAKNAKDMKEATIIYLNEIEKNKLFLKKCLSSSLGQYMTKLIRNSIIEYSTEFYYRSIKTEYARADIAQFIIEFTANGVAGFILSHMLDDDKVDIKDLAEKMYDCVFSRLANGNTPYDSNE